MFSILPQSCIYICLSPHINSSLAKQSGKYGSFMSVNYFLADLYVSDLKKLGSFSIFTVLQALNADYFLIVVIYVTLRNISPNKYN